jgi:O-antigen ligase
MLWWLVIFLGAVVILLLVVLMLVVGHIVQLGYQTAHYLEAHRARVRQSVTNNGRSTIDRV